VASNTLNKDIKKDDSYKNSSNSTPNDQDQPEIVDLTPSQQDDEEEDNTDDNAPAFNYDNEPN
jgi:hypothetical protein